MVQKDNFYNIPGPFSFYQHKASTQIVMPVLVGYFKITNCEQVKHITARIVFEKQATQEILHLPHSILRAILFTPNDSG